MDQVWRFVESIVSERRDMEKLICGDCEHAGDDWEEEPCSTCIMTPSHWVKKKEAADE